MITERRVSTLTRPSACDERLAEKVPDVVPPDGDGLGDTTDTDGKLLEDEIGGRRAGRMVSEDEGTRPNSSGLDARDIGLDGGAASAGEVAMHIVGEE